MEQWEYLTLMLRARVRNRATREYVQQRFNKKPKPYSPESMIPELDKLGAEGWELVHMQPIARVGGKEDVQVSGSDWTSSYFCVFKRRKPGSHVPVSVAAVHNPTGSP
ncbi:hypothetical protein VZO05_08935 [Aggregatilineales bacterium SYSU G02658]